MFIFKRISNFNPLFLSLYRYTGTKLKESGAALIKHLLRLPFNFCIYTVNSYHFAVHCISLDKRVRSFMEFMFFYILRFSTRVRFRIFKRAFRVIKKNKKKFKHLWKLTVSLKKKNIFFNLSKQNGNTVYITTTRRQGFLGKRMLEHASVFSTARAVKSIVRKYKKKKVALLFCGWHRFRFAIIEALQTADNFKLKMQYIKYRPNIPHNGCRLEKKRGRFYISRWVQRNIKEKDEKKISSKAALQLQTGEKNSGKKHK